MTWCDDRRLETSPGKHPAQQLELFALPGEDRPKALDHHRDTQMALVGRPRVGWRLR